MLDCRGVKSSPLFARTASNSGKFGSLLENLFLHLLFKIPLSQNYAVSQDIIARVIPSNI